MREYVKEGTQIRRISDWALIQDLDPSDNDWTQDTFWMQEPGYEQVIYETAPPGIYGGGLPDNTMLHSFGMRRNAFGAWWEETRMIASNRNSPFDYRSALHPESANTWTVGTHGGGGTWGTLSLDDGNITTRYSGGLESVRWYWSSDPYQDPPYVDEVGRVTSMNFIGITTAGLWGVGGINSGLGLVTLHDPDSGARIQSFDMMSALDLGSATYDDGYGGLFVGDGICVGQLGGDAAGNVGCFYVYVFNPIPPTDPFDAIIFIDGTTLTVRREDYFDGGIPRKCIVDETDDTILLRNNTHAFVTDGTGLIQSVTTTGGDTGSGGALGGGFDVFNGLISDNSSLQHFDPQS